MPVHHCVESSASPEYNLDLRRRCWAIVKVVHIRGSEAQGRACQARRPKSFPATESFDLRETSPGNQSDKTDSVSL